MMLTSEPGRGKSAMRGRGVDGTGTRRTPGDMGLEG